MRPCACAMLEGELIAGSAGTAAAGRSAIGGAVFWMTASGASKACPEMNPHRTGPASARSAKPASTHTTMERGDALDERPPYVDPWVDMCWAIPVERDLCAQ